jgi:hypothetical protein
VPDEKLPADDNNEREDPFAEFINRDLGMDSLLSDGIPLTPDDEGMPPARYRQHSLPQEDDDEEDASPFSARFGGIAGRIPPNSVPEEPPFRPFSVRGSPFGASPSSGPFSRSPRIPFSPSPLKPLRSTPEPPRTLWQRILEPIRKSASEEWLFLLLGFAALLIVFSTLLYIDNLRLSIAVRDGQIQELRTQLIDLQRQLTPQPELPALPLFNASSE